MFEKCSFHNASYLGLDISDKVIEYNKMMYSKEKINFQQMPASFKDLPTGDLLIIKGLFQHLSDDEIISFRDVVLGKYKFCLITNSFITEGVTTNTNIDSGGFRPLDLKEAPYCFPGAIVLSIARNHETIKTLLISNL